MNLDIIFKIIKTVLGKDTDPVEVNKPWFLKRRYWGAAIFIGSALAYKHYGLVLGDDVQEVILNNLEVVYNSLSALVSAIGVLYGIFVTAKGQIGKTNKLIVAVDTAKAECAELKAADKIATGQASASASSPSPVTKPNELPESPSE